MSLEMIARRYAGALADVVTKEGNTDVVSDELLKFNDLISANEDLRGAFFNPAISQDNKKNLLEALINKTKPNKITANFLRVLLRNDRLSQLGLINQEFVSVLEERNGIVSAKVISARELSDSEKSEMEASLIKATGGSKIKLSYEIDADIIGGAITRVGSTVYDGSVRTQLNSLREQMIKN
ncbi:MAG: ATP synthase F1 subunit delta [Pyrinomonadaceae bacterium]